MRISNPLIHGAAPGTSRQVWRMMQAGTLVCCLYTMSFMSIFIAYPFAAGLVAVAFALLAVICRRKLPGIVAILWGGYAYYEYLMLTRILCTGECNIRVDLLLIYPMLLIVSVWAVVSAFRRKNHDA